MCMSVRPSIRPLVCLSQKISKVLEGSKGPWGPVGPYGCLMGPKVPKGARMALGGPKGTRGVRRDMLTAQGSGIN